MPPRTRAPVRPPTPSQIQRQTAPFHPTTDTTTFKDLLLFEERLKMNAAMLKRRKRRYEVFLISLVLFVIFLAHHILFDPSELPLVRYITQGLLAVGLSTLVLFFASGMYQERIRYANRYVPHANRALRSINMHLNMRQPPRTIRSTLRQLPLSHYFTSSSPSAPMTKPLISPTSSVSSSDSLKGRAQKSPPAAGATSSTIIPTIPPTTNPRGELIFSSRVERQFKDGYERYRAAFERRRDEKMREEKNRKAWTFRGFVGWLLPWTDSRARASAGSAANLNGSRARSGSPMTFDGSRRESVDKLGSSSGLSSGRNTPQDGLGVRRTSTPPTVNGIRRSNNMARSSIERTNGSISGGTSSRESSVDRGPSPLSSASPFSTVNENSPSRSAHPMITRRSARTAPSTPPLPPQKPDEIASSPNPVLQPPRQATPKPSPSTRNNIAIPTPRYGKLHESVYEPAEDTFILLDALERDAEEIRALRPLICLEIGSGSGVVTAFMAEILKTSSPASVLISTDLNPNANAQTVSTHALNRTSTPNQPKSDIPLLTIRTNLLSTLEERLVGMGGIGLGCFNPPYVPTAERELEETQDQGRIGATWAGGTNGMEVTNVLLEMLPRILSPGGRFYLVAISGNDPQGIKDRTNTHTTRDGLTCEIVLKRRAGREHLHVLRFCKAIS